MKNANNNIFVGERAYKTNFFLKFMSEKIETKFRLETFIRNRFILQGFLLFSLLFIAFQFMSSDCFLYYMNCRYRGLLIFTMLCIVACFLCLHFRIAEIYLKICLLLMSFYPHMLILDKFSYDTSIILITIYTSIASCLVCHVWFWELVYNIVSYATLLAYLYLTSTLSSAIRKPLPDFLIDVACCNAVAILVLAFVEKARKEKWVLVDTFKKSEKIFRTIYEKLPYAFFVIDRNKRIHYTNFQGLHLLSHYFPSYRTCNLSKLNVNLQAFLQAECIETLDEALSRVNTEQSTACFISLKEPVEKFEGDSLYSFEKDNSYKALLTPILWKNTYGYLVAIKDYSSKTKSEKISSKAFAYLLKHIDLITGRYEEQSSERQLRMKIRMLARLDRFKMTILNTMLMFNFIFNKNQGLADKKTFNIRRNILAMIGTMSFKSRERGCDLMLTFEASFPEKIVGDEYIFQQIFFNILKMLLEKVKNTKISIDCHLASFLHDNFFLLSLEFEIPKNEYLSYETVAAKLDATTHTTLDHLLAEDEVLFYLALVRPALEIFQGKIVAEEGSNRYFIRVEISARMALQEDESIKERSIVRNPTLKACNYNASGHSRENVYFWNHEEPENVHEIGGVGPEASSSANSTEIKPKQPLIPVKDANEPKNQPKGFGHDLKLTPGQKIKEELIKITVEENKNFGGQEGKAPNRDPASQPKIEIDILKESKKSKMKKKQNKQVEEEKNALEDGDQKKPEQALETGSNSSENFEKLFESVKFHERNLKLAMTRTLLGILDNFEKKGKTENPIEFQHKLEKQERQNADGSKSPLILRDVGEELKACGLNENEMYKQVLGHLRENLMNPRYRENFVQFMRIYRKQVEDEIYSLLSDTEFTTITSFSELPNEDDIGSPDILRRALSLTDKKWSGIARGTKYDRESPPDSEKSKGRNLNERIPLTPSVSKTLRLRGSKGIVERSQQMRQFAPYYSGPSRGKTIQNVEESKQAATEGKDKLVRSESTQHRKQPSIEGINKEQEPEKIEDLKKRLLPYPSHDGLPDFLTIRMHTHRKRWIGQPYEKVKGINQEERRFIYNKVFTILAVDDSEFVYKGLEVLPTKFERKLDYAKNGTEALKKYLHSINQGVLYHLVLMDLQMPVMDGFETARNIRAEEIEKNYPRTYICAMSAFEDQETINKTKREGMDNFCQKPLRLEVLNNLIKTRLEEIGINPPQSPFKKEENI